METVNTAGDPAHAARPKDDVIRIEVIHAGSVEAVVMELPPGEDLLAALRLALAIEDDLLVFERDQDEPLACLPPGRKALRLVTHKAHTIELEVRYDHKTFKKAFPPSKTVFKALQWAVGKHAFDLDPASAAKANLILPGADEPLPREAVIGSYVPHGHHVLVVDLTLRDFTNG
jgi:hypothetical protein